MKKLFLILALLAVTAQAKLAQVAGNDELTVYVDFDTYRVVRKNVYRVWLLYNAKETIVIENLKFRSYRTYREFDCEERRQRQLASSAYSELDGQGKVVITTGEREWAYYAPETLVGSVAKVVCH